MTLVYLDVETTGLDPDRHEIWEVAWAVDDGPIQSGVLNHSLRNADPVALGINGYSWRRPLLLNADEAALRESLTGATLVAANPAFDAGFLRARWGATPWRYRLFDIEAYAVPLLDSDVPQGLNKIAAALGVDAPDHTAAADVHTLRECHLTLRTAYKGQVWE